MSLKKKKKKNANDRIKAWIYITMFRSRINSGKTVENQNKYNLP